MMRITKNNIYKIIRNMKTLVENCEKIKSVTYNEDTKCIEIQSEECEGKTETQMDETTITFTITLKN